MRKSMTFKTLDEPGPPFAKRLIGLKLSDVGRLTITYFVKRLYISLI